MACGELLKPTLHVEVRLKSAPASSQQSRETCSAVQTRLIEDYDALEVGENVNGFGMEHAENVISVEIADYTGPANSSGIHVLAGVQLDVQCYVLKSVKQPDTRPQIKRPKEDDMPQMTILALPNVTLNDAWSSLVFDEALPARLLRYLVRMVDMMSSPDLNLSTFNWNRLCLLHGPPGSGKSTLCLALAQKLSVRLGHSFSKAALVEISTNSLLSKYFGESGKHILSMFERIATMCDDRKMLVCVVMDEVETIVGSRDKAANGSECTDGLRATNQLLTALDRLRNTPNVIVLCTSNLIEAIDPAFLDRVDIKQLIPSPSPSAIYNILRSCLNEMVRSNLVQTTEVPSPASETRESSSTFTAYNTSTSSSSSPRKTSTRPKRKGTTTTPTTSEQPVASSPEPWNFIAAQDNIPMFVEMKVRLSTHPNPQSPGERVWALAQSCQGFSGRTLRRLPILGLAMHTWGGECSLGDAISALEKAVEQELAVAKVMKGDVDMSGV